MIPNVRVFGGETALMLAAAGNPSPGVVLALLDSGVDVPAEDSAGKTAWDLIQENKNLEGSETYL